MDRHYHRIQVIKYCKNPEYYLEEAACHYIKVNPYEEEDSYQVRLSRAFSSFEPVYTHLRNLVVSTALRKKIKLNGDMQKWEKFFKNVDLEGNSIQVFARNIFSEAIDGGWAGILVDYPNIPEGLSRAEEERRYPNARAYLTAVKAESILDTQFKSNNETMLDESEYGRQLSMLRIADTKIEADPEDEFSQIRRRAEKVYDVVEREMPNGTREQRARFRYYVEKNAEDTGKPVMMQEGSEIILTSKIIPYAIIPGGAHEGDGIYRPLMLDTARLNMQHWVMSADLSNMINITANPRFVISGVWDRMKGILSSSSRALVLTDKDSKADWKGAPMDGANIIRMRLQDLIQSMKSLAIVAMNPSQTVQPQSGVAKVIDKSQADSLLNVLVTSLEVGINQALRIAADFERERNAPSISLSKSFVAAPLHSQQILALAQLFEKGLVDARLVLEIMEAGDFFEGLPDFTVESILSRLNIGEDGRPLATAIVSASAAGQREAPATGEVVEADRA